MFYCFVNNLFISGVKEVATLQNIDSYMSNLHSMLVECNNENASLMRMVKEIISQMEFNG